MKPVKIAAAVLGGLLALAAAAVLSLAWLFEPDDYKQALAAEFERRTGRTLAIDDALELEYLPRLAVETGAVSVGNAPGFSERDFARVERLAARIEILPLLRGEWRIGTIVLDGLELNLETDALGRSNWTPPADAQAPDPSAPVEGASGFLNALDVDGLRILDGLVTWTDLASGRTLSMRDLSLIVGAYRPDEPVAVEAAFRAADSATGSDAAIDARAVLEYADAALSLRGLRGDVAVSLPGSFAAQATIAADEIEWRRPGVLRTTRAAAAGWLEAAALDGARREVEAAWPLAELDLASGALRAEHLTTSIGAVHVHWQLTGERLREGGRIAGRATVEQAPLAETLSAFSVRLPEAVAANALGRFDVTAPFVARLEPLALELAGFEVRALGAALTGTAAIGGNAPRRLIGTFEVPAFAPSDALRAWLEPHLPVDVALEAFESVALAADVDVDPARRTVALESVRAELLGAALTGHARIALTDAGVSATGRLASTRIAPGRFEAAFDRLLTDTLDPGELGLLAFDAAFDYDGPADRLRLEPLRLEAFGLSATGSLTASALNTAPVYVGKARIDEIAPRALMQRFGRAPPQTSDPTALARASLETSFDVRPDRGDFSDVVVRLDDSLITGEFTVLDFMNPAYRFALAVDRLDADRYLPPRTAEAAPGERTAGDLALDGAALDALDLSGRVAIGALAIAGLELEQVATQIEIGRGAARLDDAHARLYGGRFDGAFAVDSSGALPAMTLTGRAENIELGSLITDLNGRSDFSGTGDFDLALTGSGRTVADNVASAAGAAGFAIRDGAIEGFDLGRALCAAYNVTQRLPSPPEPDAERTRYRLLSGTADVAGGVATSPDLLARTAFMDVTGTGSIDLVRQALDYTLEAELTAPVAIPRCESMDALVGDSIPLTLGGTIDDPRIRPDFGEIVKRRVQDALRDRATRDLEERIRERLRDIF